MESSNYNVSTQIHSLLDVVMNLVPAYILPFGVILSLMSNTFALRVLIGNERIINTLPPTLRINFIANAINDLNCLGPIHLTIILGDGLYYASGGKYNVRWDLFSNVTCKFRYFWYFQSDSLSQYLLLALAVERVVSLYQPLAVRVWANQRNACFMCATLILASIIIAAPTLEDFEIKEYSISTHELRCIMVHHDWKQLIRFIFINALLCVNLPRIAVFVCIIILSRKIRAASAFHQRLREALVAQQNKWRCCEVKKGAILQRELRLARPVFLAAVFELLMTLQLVLTWALYFLFRALHYPPEWVKLAGAGGHMAIYLTIVSRIWNLYIYCATIPAFRHELLRILLCRCNTKKQRARSVSTNATSGAAGAHRSAASRDSQPGGGVVLQSRSGTTVSEKLVSMPLNRYDDDTIVL